MFRKTKYYGLVIYAMIALIPLLSCDGKSGYLTSYENERLDLLTGVKWIRFIPDNSNLDSPSSYELWTFYKNTNCTCETGIIENDELIIYDIEYLQWQFTTSTYSVLYFSNSKYWLINRLDALMFSVSQSWEDPVIIPGQYIINKEFVPFE